jgi:hypothetical protein
MKPELKRKIRRAIEMSQKMVSVENDENVKGTVIHKVHSEARWDAPSQDEIAWADLEGFALEPLMVPIGDRALFQGIIASRPPIETDETVLTVLIFHSLRAKEGVQTSELTGFAQKTVADIIKKFDDPELLPCEVHAYPMPVWMMTAYYGAPTRNVIKFDPYEGIPPDPPKTEFESYDDIPTEKRGQ